MKKTLNLIIGSGLIIGLTLVAIPISLINAIFFEDDLFTLDIYYNNIYDEYF